MHFRASGSELHQGFRIRDEGWGFADVCGRGLQKAKPVSGLRGSGSTSSLTECGKQWQEEAKAAERVRHLKDGRRIGKTAVSFSWSKDQVCTFSAGTFATCIGTVPTGHRREQAAAAACRRGCGGQCISGVSRSTRHGCSGWPKSRRG